MLFAPAAAHNAPAKGTAHLRLEVRADPCAGVCAGGTVARRALGATEAGTTDPDPYRAPRLHRAAAAAAAQGRQALPHSFRYLVVGRAACLGQNDRVYMNSITILVDWKMSGGNRCLIRSWTCSS